jgi:hypothetical protein
MERENVEYSAQAEGKERDVEAGAVAKYKELAESAPRRSSIHKTSEAADPREIVAAEARRKSP